MRFCLLLQRKLASVPESIDDLRHKIDLESFMRHQYVKKKHHDVVQDTWYETKNITMLTGALLKIQNLWALYGVVVTVAQQRQLSRGITVLEHFSRMILKEYYILLCL